MAQPLNNGYFPKSQKGKGMIQRFARWALECRHEYSVTGTNGYGLPAECQCDRCGMYWHRELEADELPNVAEWKSGRHPGAQI